MSDLATTAGRRFSGIRSKRRSRQAATILAYVLLVFGCLLVLAPFLIVLSTSIKTYPESVRVPFRLFPEEWTGEAYAAIFRDAALARGLWNTLVVVCPVMLVGVFTSALSAFAFAKIRYRGKNFLFSVLLLTMMLPGVVTMTPAYVLYDLLRLVDTYAPLMLPGLFGTAACVFYLRQYFSGLPDELLEAAKIDGLGYFGIFLRVILPLSVPALLAQVILWFITGYNDYFGPMLYLFTEEKYTLQLVLNLMAGSADSNWPKIMAGSVAALAPTLVIYFVAQKFFIEGIVMTGLKG